MQNQFSRTALLVGSKSIQILANSTVAVFGIGGVGSFVVEGLVRGGVGRLILIDNDLISMTNLNRQIHATHATLGKWKTNTMKERILSINPQVKVETFETFCLPDNVANLINDDYDYIVDAIDTVSGKIALAQEATNRKLPIISCMGTGNKLNPMAFEIADIYDTSVCPLCRTMRKELKKRNIPSLEVVYSKEPPLSPTKYITDEITAKKQIPGSMSFVPPVAGMIIAGEVIKNLIKN